MPEFVTQEAADRIRRMELCFDALQAAADQRPAAIREDPSLKRLLQKLTQYYESGLWRRDYELDEKGCFPPELKRGVLAQDAVYNFLDRLKDDKSYLENSEG